MAAVGGIWAVKSGGKFVKDFSLDQAGFNAAKTYCTDNGGGFIEITPGGESIVTGVMPTNVLVLRVGNEGHFTVSGLCASDTQDPTKAIEFILNQVSSGFRRQLTFPDWSGTIQVADASAGSGSAGDALISQGPNLPPTWGPGGSGGALTGATQGDVLVGGTAGIFDKLPIGIGILTANGITAAWQPNTGVNFNELNNILTARLTSYLLLPSTGSQTVGVGYTAPNSGAPGDLALGGRLAVRGSIWALGILPTSWTAVEGASLWIKPSAVSRSLMCFPGVSTLTTFPQADSLEWDGVALYVVDHTGVRKALGYSGEGVLANALYDSAVSY